MAKRKKLFSGKKNEKEQNSARKENPAAKKRAIEAQFRRMQEKRARKTRLEEEKRGRLYEISQERERELRLAREAEEERRRQGVARRALIREEIEKRKEEERKRKERLEEALFSGQELDLEDVPLPEPIVPGEAEIEETPQPIKPKIKEKEPESSEQELDEELQESRPALSEEPREIFKEQRGQIEIIKTGMSSSRGSQKRRSKKKKSSAIKEKIKRQKQEKRYFSLQKELKKAYNNYQEKQAAKYSEQNREAMLRAREKIDPDYTAAKRKRDPRLEKALSFFDREWQAPFAKSWQRWREKKLRENLKDVVGLDIGAATIRAVYSGPRGVLLAERPLPEGLIAAGILQDVDELAEEIKGLWEEASIGSKKVSFSLASELLTVRTVFLPSGDEGDIASALALNADAIISPMRADESIIDYKTLLRSGPDVALQVAAADKTVTKDYLKAVKSAGLLPVSCQAGPLAASRNVVVPRNPNSSHAIIDIGAETTKVLACSGPDAFYLRVIPIAGNHFTRAIMQELNISWQEAEKLKISSSIKEEDQDNRALLRAQRPIADRLAQEILQTKERYSLSEIGEKRPLENCLFLGGGSLLSGLREQIHFFAGFREIIDLAPATEIQDPEALNLFSPAIGLALGSDTSLLPEDDSSFWRPGITARVSGENKQGKRIIAREKRRVSPLLLSLLLSVVLLTGSIFWKNSLDSQSETLRNQIALEDKIIANDQAKAALSWESFSSWVSENKARVVAIRDASDAQDITLIWSRSLEALRLGLSQKGFVIKEIRVAPRSGGKKIKVVLANE